MAAQFDRLFALTENPFRPIKKIGKGNPGTMNNLDQQPLQIHKVPELRRLFVETAGQFRDCIRRFEEAMEENGYSRDESQDTQQSLSFVIRGPSGAGKTTLANYLASVAAEYKLPNPKTWTTVDYLSVDSFPQLQTQRERIDAVLKALKDRVGDDNYGCVILDNLETDDDEYIQTALKGIVQTRIVIAFLIAKGASAFGRRASFAAFGYPEFGLEFLNEDQALAFVAARLETFRCAAAPAWIKQQKWVTFPFSPVEIKRAVVFNLFGDGKVQAARSSTSIRNLNVILAKALRMEQQRRINDGADIRTLALDRVESYVMDLLGHLEKLWDRRTAA